MLFVFHFFDPKNSDPDGSESITLMKKKFLPGEKYFFSQCTQGILFFNTRVRKEQELDPWICDDPYLLPVPSSYFWL